MFTDEQKKFIKEKLRAYNLFFGYVKIPGQENPYGFFEYDDLTPEEIETANNAYLRYRENARQWYIKDQEKIDKTHIEVEIPKDFEQPKLIYLDHYEIVFKLQMSD